jgi:enoyl-CoA hydratase
MPTFTRETMYCETDGPLARLYLNRPQVLNAANWAWVQDLVAITDYLKQHPEIHVVIVSGKGRSFCSGLDVKELAQGHFSLDWFMTWERGVTALAQLNAITIAAIHGYCLGGGLQVALACDLRVATNDAVLSIPAVREGVVAALGPMRLTREQGLALGVLVEVVAPEQLEQRALAMAQELLSIPFTALLHTKRQIDSAFEKDTATLMNELSTAQEECLRSPEHAAVMAEYREQQAKRSAKVEP